MGFLCHSKHNYLDYRPRYSASSRKWDYLVVVESMELTSLAELPRMPAAPHQSYLLFG